MRRNSKGTALIAGPLFYYPRKFCLRMFSIAWTKRTERTKGESFYSVQKSLNGFTRLIRRCIVTHIAGNLHPALPLNVSKREVHPHATAIYPIDKPIRRITPAQQLHQAAMLPLAFRTVQPLDLNNARCIWVIRQGSCHTVHHHLRTCGKLPLQV